MQASSEAEELRARIDELKRKHADEEEWWRAVKPPQQLSNDIGKYMVKVFLGKRETKPVASSAAKSAKKRRKVGARSTRKRKQ